MDKMRGSGRVNVEISHGNSIQETSDVTTNANEWYTPARYVDAAREVMNGIALDPASCAAANQIVRAQRYYTREENGLAQDWACDALWLNPPFGIAPGGKSNMAIWAMRLIDEYQQGRVKQAILVCMANTEASWFTSLWNYPICFPSPRVLFHRPSGKLDHHNQGTCFVYFGVQVQRFMTLFRKFGPVVTPDGVHRLTGSIKESSLLEREAVS
jgi:ParB family chromosome partitioning protein